MVHECVYNSEAHGGSKQITVNGKFRIIDSASMEDVAYRNIPLPLYKCQNANMYLKYSDCLFHKTTGGGE